MQWRETAPCPVLLIDPLIETAMRRALSCLLILALLVACSKHHAEPAAGAPQVTRSNDPLSPDNFFDPKLNPGAIVATEFLDPKKMTASQLQYGVAPKRDPRVTYAPDIILMEQGDQAIRIAGRDGMTWSFDAKAPHVNEFEEGKIVFATGRAVGRVAKMSSNGTLVTVKLAPIQITEVIKDGHFLIDSDLDVKSLITYEAPDFPALMDLNDGNANSTGWSDSSGDQAPRLLRTAFLRTMQNGLPSGLGSLDPPLEVPPAVANVEGALPQINLSSFMKAVPIAGSDGSVGANFSYNNNGTWVDVTGKVVIGKAHIKFELDIQNFRVITFGMDLGGATSLVVALSATSDINQVINIKQQVTLPTDIYLPIPVGGVPLALTFHVSYSIETAFSAKRSAFTATGEYGISGDIFIGKKNGQFMPAPQLHPVAKTEITNSIKGISVGMNSLIAGVSVRPMIGIGAFGFNTGVFVGVDFSGSVLKQSDIVMAKCRAGYVKGFLDSGVGYQLPRKFIAVINGILSVFTKYKMPDSGVLIPGPTPPPQFMDLNVEIPEKCATPKQGV
jgi:hypothetical protein